MGASERSNGRHGSHFPAEGPFEAGANRLLNIGLTHACSGSLVQAAGKERDSVHFRFGSLTSGCRFCLLANGLLLGPWAQSDA